MSVTNRGLRVTRDETDDVLPAHVSLYVGSRR